MGGMLKKKHTNKHESRFVCFVVERYYVRKSIKRSGINS
jgi:hypothetical protein